MTEVEDKIKTRIDEVLVKLKKHRNELMYEICENDKIYHHDIIVSLVFDLRSTIRQIRLLEGDEDTNVKFKEENNQP